MAPSNEQLAGAIGGVLFCVSYALTFSVCYTGYLGYLAVGSALCLGSPSLQVSAAA